MSTTSASTARRVLLVVNPHARRGRDGAERAAAALRASGHAVLTAALPRRATGLTPLIAGYRDRVDVVAVGGGDGTLISAIEGIRALDLPLLILPLGTFNELARTLGIPLDLAAACALLDRDTTRAIDIGCVNGHLFFNEASIGLSTHVAREQTAEVKGRFGMLAIPLATLRSLRALRPYHLDVETETGSERFRTVQLTVANSYRFGGVVENTEASIDDGTLDLYSIDIRRPWDALSVIVAVALKRFPKSRCVRDLRGRRFVVRSRHPHRVFADGEPATHTPAEFTVIPAAVRVYAPNGAK